MITDLIDGGIYVIHSKSGYEYQEKRITELFKKNNLEFEFVTDGDTSLFTNELIQQYFVPEIETKLRKGILSCTLNHIFAYKRMVEKNDKYALIFENDPFFLGDFVKRLNKLNKEILGLEKGFIISIENTTLTFPSFWDIRKNKYLYPAKTGRMAGAYIIDFEGANNLLKSLESQKCNTVIDWWHNGLIENGIIKMYWAHPALVEQGSHNGQMSSSISTKQKSNTRKLGWLFHKFYKMYFRRLFKQNRIITIK
jgi:glycosyl transferase family 25